EIIFDRHLPECQILSDRNRLNQVIANFVNNAIKFTSTGSIRVGYDKIDEKNIRFYVADTGIGIDAERQTQIFERFIKLNSFVHGTGLGLSISKSIVEQLGGTIGVDSTPGEGSCFWFILPID
uniref:sensor histidine kinase n=1 Tax=Bacteroides sp. TaxID=29523 RepID=UPI0026317B08